MEVFYRLDITHVLGEWSRRRELNTPFCGECELSTEMRNITVNLN